MLIGLFMLQVVLDELGPGSIWVSGVEDVEEHVRTVDHFVEFFPDTLGLTLEKNSVFHLVLIFEIVFVKVFVVGFVVLGMIVANFH